MKAINKVKSNSIISKLSKSLLPEASVKVA